MVALVLKNLSANAGDIRDAGSIPGSGRSSGVGDGHLLEYSWLENSIDRGAWWVTVHGVTKRRRQLNTHTHTHTHTSIWRELTYFPIHDHNMPLHLFTSSVFWFF